MTVKRLQFKDEADSVNRALSFENIQPAARLHILPFGFLRRGLHNNSKLQKNGVGECWRKAKEVFKLAGEQVSKWTTRPHSGR